MNAPQSNSQTTRRRWFRFSLRTLFVVMTIAAVWLGFTMKRLRDQERAVALVRATSGHLVHDYERSAGGSAQNLKPPGPEWIRRILGSQWNVRVVQIAVCSNAGRAPSDEDFATLRALRDLEIISIYECDDLTNEALKHVVAFRKLKTFAMDGTPHVTDEGLVYFRNLSSLTTLNLMGCNMNGSGLRYVAHLPIVRLLLRSTPVTDENLAAIASMRQLQDLDLESTRITDAGVEHLIGLVGLKTLNVSGTKVTEEGRMRIWHALPDVKISF